MFYAIQVTANQKRFWFKKKGVALEGNELKQLKTEEWTEGLL